MTCITHLPICPCFSFQTEAKDKVFFIFFTYVEEKASIVGTDVSVLSLVRVSVELESMFARVLLLVAALLC